VSPGQVDVALAELLAERDIRRVILQYCRGIDRMDPVLVRSCYHDDATDDHGSAIRTADDYVAWAFRLLRRYEMTMHLVANMSIEVTGDVALAETYGISFHRTAPDQPMDPKLNLISGFRFVDRFERRGEWRIAKRVITAEWSRVDDLEGRWPFPDSLRRGTRDDQDPVWWLVPELGLAHSPEAEAQQAEG